MKQILKTRLTELNDLISYYLTKSETKEIRGILKMLNLSKETTEKLIEKL